MFGSLMNFDNVFDEFRRLQRDVDSLFESRPGWASIRAVARGSYPPINVGSTPEAVQLYLFAAGLDTAKLDISIQENLLTINGERKTEKPGAEGGGNYHLRERFGGAFRRVLSLPDDVDPDKVDARYKDGVLHITVGRRESTVPRQIEIKSE